MNIGKQLNYQFELSLRVLTPLHIGMGDTLTSVGEYLTTSDKVRYLNPDKLNEFLKDKNLTDDYTQKILEAGSGFDTFTTLRDYNLNIEDLILNELPLRHKDLNPFNNNILHIFHHKNGNKYVPGSSLKGMLKTVLLFDYLKNNRNYLGELEKYIKEHISQWNRKAVENWLNDQWDSKEFFSNREFNLLRCNDSSYITEAELQIEQVIRRHLYGVKTEGLDWLEETVKPESEIAMSMTIVPQFSNRFSVLNNPDIKPLFGLINEYSMHLIGFEKELISGSAYENKNVLIKFLEGLQEQIGSSQNEYAVCRLGKGKSIYFQTILSLLDKEVLKSLIGKWKDIKNGDSPHFPKTRVLTAYDEMPGWIIIKLNDTNKENA